MEFVRQVGGKIVDYTVGKVGEQLGYLIHYKHNIRELKEKNEVLKVKKEDLQRKITKAEKNLEVIIGTVQIWVERVVEITTDVDNLLEDDQKEATHRCFNGWCINLWARYKFGKKAFEKTNEITKLQETEFENVSAGPRDLTEIKPSPSREMFRGIESRTKKVKDIMEALDDGNINIIGICGMGGVGKTTIVKKVRAQAIEEKKFDKTIMVVVSQTPNFKNIQDEIANELGLDLKQWPTSSSRTAALWHRIKEENKIMIILDDVWKRLDLMEHVGIPFGVDHKGCKILLTTRDEHVCKEMNAQRTFTIQCLSEPEDWILFKEKVGETVECSELKNIASEVVRGCGGLPIAIVTIGMALKERNKHVWMDANKQLKMPFPNKIQGVDGLVYSRLKLSYSYLEDNEAKSLFLLCSLFPEDFEIEVESLAQYGMGLRLFQNVNTIEVGKIRSHALVSTLVSSFLLLEGKEDGYVKMHDVIRDVAIVIASEEEEKKYMVNAGVGLRDWPKSLMTASFQSCTGISLMYNDIHKLPDELIESPKLHVLLLQNNYELHIPTNFFQGMKNLKVLDMGGNRIQFMPTSIQWLTSLKTLCLDGCKLGDNISIIGTLKQLEILNLRGSDIEEVPGNFCQLIHLMSLDLRNCGYLKKITSGVISSLCKLEELYIAFHFTYWAGIEGGEDSRSNASLAELKSLHRLTSLSIYVPNVNLLPYDLKLQSLTEFDIIIGYKGDDPYYNLWTVNHRLILSYDTANYNRLSEAVHDLLKRTKSLILIDCKGLTNILKDFDNNEGFVELEICHGQLPAESFSKLQMLEVKSCDSMSNVFDLEGLAIGDDQLDDIKLLSSLEKLYLRKLPNLIHVWKGPHDHFVKLHNQLRSIHVSECPNLRQLFPPLIAQSLVRLETLGVQYCDNMEEIFGTYNEDGINQKSVVGKSLNTNMSFTNLVRVYVSDCNRLRNIFTPSIADGLAQLTKLGVASCGMMKAVAELEDDPRKEGDEVENITLFPRLVEIGLWKLENICCFCTSRSTITFPSLQELEIRSCPKMETFGNGVVITPKLNEVRALYWEGVHIKSKDIWKGDLNATVQHMFNNHGRYQDHLPGAYLDNIIVRFRDSPEELLELSNTYFNYERDHHSLPPSEAIAR